MVSTKNKAAKKEHVLEERSKVKQFVIGEVQKVFITKKHKTLFLFLA